MQLTFSHRPPLTLDRPVIMGILNATPDSFSDGGRFVDADAAADHAAAMSRDGAKVIDVGGESTRPGSERTPAEEQTRRVVPVIQRVRDRLPEAIISVDTTRAGVAEAGLDAGADLINDVSAGRDDERIYTVAAERGAPIVLMHMQGEPATMQDAPRYDDVVAEVVAFLLERAELAHHSGVPRGQVVLDPGIGFGKTLEHNLQLLACLDELVATGYPVLVGASRKGMIKHLTPELQRDRADADHRLGGTTAITALAIAAGAHLHRVHDVWDATQAAAVADAIHRSRR